MPGVVFVSEALRPKPREGAQVLAGQLTEHLWMVHRGRSLGPSTGTVPHAKPVLSDRHLGVRSLSEIRRIKPDHLVYLPANGLTRASLLRAAAIWAAGRRPPLELIVLQDFLPQDWSLRRLAPRSWSFVAATAVQAKRLSNSGHQVRMTVPRVACSRVGQRQSQHAAREMLGLPDGHVFLHVGHARERRNLAALRPLCDIGTVVVILSDYGPESPDTVPQHENLRVVRGYVSSIGDYYQAASAYVFPTVDPGSVIGTPLSVFEALANGTPVVARQSEALARWEGVPGLYLVRTDRELIELLRQPGQLARPVKGQFADIQQCRADLAVCVDHAATAEGRP